MKEYNIKQSLKGYQPTKAAAKNKYRRADLSGYGRKIFFLTFNFIVFLNFRVIAQENKNTKPIDSCNLPFAVWLAFDTNKCKKHVDTIDRMYSELRIDSLGDRYYQLWGTSDFSMYYELDTDKYRYLDIYLNQISLIIVYGENGLMKSMRYIDSCKITEINYDNFGNIWQQFYCDYSKPNNCYSKEYINGKIMYEEIYSPRCFQSDIPDSVNIDAFGDEMRVVPIRYIDFDTNGKVKHDNKINIHPTQK